jgi:hypothetical protein
MGKMRNASKSLVELGKERELRDTEVDGRIILKYIL